MEGEERKDKRKGGRYQGLEDRKIAMNSRKSGIQEGAGMIGRKIER